MDVKNKENGLKRMEKLHSLYFQTVISEKETV